MASADFHPPPPSSFTTALDLAEALVERGVPFREAHRAVGGVVSALLAGGRELAEATVDDLREADGRFVESDLERLDPASSMRRRRSPGGGSPDSVRTQVASLRAAVARLGASLD